MEAGGRVRGSRKVVISRKSSAILKTAPSTGGTFASGGGGQSAGQKGHDRAHLQCADRPMCRCWSGAVCVGCYGCCCCGGGGGGGGCDEAAAHQELKPRETAPAIASPQPLALC